MEASPSHERLAFLFLSSEKKLGEGSRRGYMQVWFAWQVIAPMQSALVRHCTH